MRKAIIGLYRHDERTKQSTLVERIEMEEALDALTRRRNWKTAVEELVAKRGFKVISINLVAGEADLDVNIIASVEQPPPRLGERKKAVARAGVPMRGPVSAGKTMAAKRRAARETPRR